MIDLSDSPATPSKTTSFFPNLVNIAPASLAGADLHSVRNLADYHALQNRMQGLIETSRQQQLQSSAPLPNTARPPPPSLPSTTSNLSAKDNVITIDDD
jgi:hypothetical protein